MCSHTTASGGASTAMGHGTIASAEYSTAIGLWTIASGFASTALGREIEANGDYSLAIALSDQNGISVTQDNTMSIMGGNVGIGTISPTEMLEVNGVIVVTGGNSSDWNTAYGWGNHATAEYLTTESDPYVGNKTSGKWCIGNGTQITATADPPVTEVIAGTGLDGGGTTTTITLDHSDMSSQTSVNNSGGTVIQDISLGTLGHVTGIQSIQLDDRYYTESEADSRYLKTTGGSMTPSAILFTGHVHAAGSGGLELYDNSGNSGIFIEDGGKVGIGTTSPDKLFTVYTDNASEMALFENKSASDPDGIVIRTGPANPGNTVDFIAFQDTIPNNVGSIDGDGAGGVRYNTTSDVRLKTNIRDYSGGLKTVSQIKVRNYEMKSAPGVEKIGLIAQELQEIYPQAVSGSPNSEVKTDPMMIDYGNITPLLINAIQELQKENEALKQRLAKMELHYK